MEGDATRCIVCRSAELLPLVTIRQLPILANELWPTAAEARAAPVGDLHLVFCPACGHLFNRGYDPARVHYGAAYENPLHHSGRFQAYADRLAEELVQHHALRDRMVVEIGCGDGTFLAQLCRRGHCRGIGFDPGAASAAEREKATVPGRSAITILPRPFTGEDATLAPALVVARHVIEHLADPVAQLETIRLALEAGSGCGLYIEVPNGGRTLRGEGIGDLVYEHCSYFTELSLPEACARAGLPPGDIREAYEGQFLRLEIRAGATIRNGAGSHPGGVPTDDAMTRGSAALGELRAAAERFAQAYRAQLEEWRRVLAGIRKRGQRAVLWGAGSKGTTFANLLSTGEWIPYLVDLNPRKHDRYVAGTGQRIISPKAMRAYAPEVILVMNPIYAHEIRAQVQEMGVAAEIRAV